MNPRESGAYIAKRSKHVSIHQSAVDSAAQQILARMKGEQYSTKTWREWPLHPKELNKETVDWIFVVDSLNFSFWLPGAKQFQVEYQGKKYEDYEALCACINRAIEEGFPITTPTYYKNITQDKIEHVFRSCNDTKLPLLEQRRNNLNDAGTIFTRDYDGLFANFLDGCGKDVNTIIRRVTETFSSFRDIANFEGEQVCFYKRVQILIADIWACFDKQSYGAFENIDQLTMFADYRVPQSLLAFGVITYTESLMRDIRDGNHLESGSREEMEIRGCSIHAVELLREVIRRIDPATDINAVIIDFYLWDYATKCADKMSQFPEHRTRSTFY